MISFLSGKPVIDSNQLIMVVNGVGYGVQVGQRLLTLAQRSDQLEIYTFTHVKEDKLELYGFSNPQELQLFKLVLAVSGVGPKIALALVDTGADNLISGVQNANVRLFTAVPRVGKKLAQKIIIDLKSKLGSLHELNLTPLSPLQQDAAQALEQLGFNDQDIRLALDEIGVDHDDIQVIIKLAIKTLSTKRG